MADLEMRNLCDVDASVKKEVRATLQALGKHLNNTPEGIAINTFATYLLKDNGEIPRTKYTHKGWLLEQREELEAHVEALAEACCGMLAYASSAVEAFKDPDGDMCLVEDADDVS